MRKTSKAVLIKKLRVEVRLIDGNEMLYNIGLPKQGNYAILLTTFFKHLNQLKI